MTKNNLLLFLFAVLVIISCAKKTPVDIITDSIQQSSMSESSGGRFYYSEGGGDETIERFIIVYKKDIFTSTVAGSVRQYNESLLVKNNVSNPNIIKVYKDIMNAVVVEISVGDAKKLAKESGVEFISYFNNIFELPPVSAQTVPAGAGQLIPWHIMRIGGPKNSTGSVVWIVDSGVDLSYQNTELVIDTTRAWSYSSNLNDTYGHGTAVAGIIGALDNNTGVVGVAPGAIIIPVKVSEGRYLYDIDIIDGLDHIYQYGNEGEIVNMSFSGEGDPSIDYAVQQLVNKGLTVVVSAGNESQNALNRSPARVPDAVTVSAIDQDDEFCDFSNYGYVVDYAAPGEDGITLGLGGQLRPFSGTSMAAPHVAGFFASNRLFDVNGYAINDPDGMDDPIIFTGDIPTPPSVTNLYIHYSGSGPSPLFLQELPSGGSVVEVTSSYNELTWNWGVTSMTYPGESVEYTIERCLFAPTNFAVIGTSTTGYYKDMGGIAEGKTYYYRVTANRHIYKNTYLSTPCVESITTTTY